jgi:hypothetical protein
MAVMAMGCLVGLDGVFWWGTVAVVAVHSPPPSFSLCCRHCFDLFLALGCTFRRAFGSEDLSGKQGLKSSTVRVTDSGCFKV